MPGTVRASYDPAVFFDGMGGPNPRSGRKNAEADDRPARSSSSKSTRELAARRARLAGRKL